METTREMQALVGALRKVRTGYPSTMAMAEAGGLEYPALWRVLDGRGRRSVGIEFLTTAMAKWPEVAEAMAAQVTQKEAGAAPVVSETTDEDDGADIAPGEMPSLHVQADEFTDEPDLRPITSADGDVPF